VILGWKKGERKKGGRPAIGEVDLVLVGNDRRGGREVNKTLKVKRSHYGRVRGWGGKKANREGKNIYIGYLLEQLRISAKKWRAQCNTRKSSEEVEHSGKHWTVGVCAKVEEWKKKEERKQRYP